MTQILTVREREPEAFDAAVNAALREGERWAKMGAGSIQTHYHDGWFVAVLVWSAPDQPTRRADRGL
jgi:hypothetical protein